LKDSNIHIIKNKKNFIELKHSTIDGLEREVVYVQHSPTSSWVVLFPNDKSENFLIDLSKKIYTNDVIEASTESELIFLYRTFLALKESLPDAIIMNFYVRKELYKDFLAIEKYGETKFKRLLKLRNLS